MNWIYWLKYFQRNKVIELNEKAVKVTSEFEVKRPVNVFSACRV